MRKIAIIGLGCGDEGKGMVTSSLAQHYIDDKQFKNRILVIRYSGGHQAGHTVHVNGMSHVFANFGSGTLQGIPTYWDRMCTVDPVGIVNELDVLADTMKDSFDTIRLFINPDCPVTTPFDKYATQCGDYLANGTCGVGFGATIGREKAGYHLRFADLFNSTIVVEKMKLIKKYYGAGDKFSVKDFLESVEALTFWDRYSKFVKMSSDVTDHYDTILFEGSQGLLLDKDIGFFPHVTRANVGMMNLAYRYEPIDKVYYVTRAYQTRHGNGPMTHKGPLKLDCTEHETNVDNEYQGKFRTGVLDVSLLQHAIDNDRRHAGFSTTREENLVITCMDQLTDYRFIQNGKIRTFDNERDFIQQIMNILKIGNDAYLSRSVNSELELWK